MGTTVYKIDVGRLGRCLDTKQIIDEGNRIYLKGCNIDRMQGFAGTTSHKWYRKHQS
jgi:hypothetical protein